MVCLSKGIEESLETGVFTWFLSWALLWNITPSCDELDYKNHSSEDTYVCILPQTSWIFKVSDQCSITTLKISNLTMVTQLYKQTRKKVNQFGKWGLYDGWLDGSISDTF